MTASQRLLCVCGHPDDETIHMAGTLARYAAQQASILCLTATRGELGEVVDRELAAALPPGGLGDLRMAEMGRAVRHLGAIEVRWLGYRDSGPDDDARNGDADAFDSVPLDDAAGAIAREIRALRPQVVVTLRSADGGGHPDHLQAALATRLAFERAGDPEAWPEQLEGPGALTPWTASKLYEWHGHTRTPLGTAARLRSVIHDRGPVAALPVIARAVVRLAVRSPTAGPPAAAPLPTASPRPAATTHIDVGRWTSERDAAIREYRSQIRPDDELLVWAPAELARLQPTEDYTLLSGPRCCDPEVDLFDGVDGVCTTTGARSTAPAATVERVAT